MYMEFGVSRYPLRTAASSSRFRTFSLNTHIGCGAQNCMGTIHDVWCVANLNRAWTAQYSGSRRKLDCDRFSTRHGRRLAVLMLDLQKFEAVELSHEATQDADLRESVQISSSSSRHQSSSHDAEQFGKKTTGQPWRTLHWNVSTP